MASLNSIISISITKGTQAVSVQAFNVACIFGSSGRIDAGTIQYFSGTAAMLTAGFTTSDPEYKAASELMGQSPSPTQFAVSTFSTPATQIDTITPTAVNSHVYDVTISGTSYSFTASSSATAGNIVSGLIALINADSNCPATASGTSTLILTGKAAGAGFVTSTNNDSNMALDHTTANHSIADDIAALQTVDDNWYGVITTSHNTNDILQVAAYCESQLKVFCTSSNDANIVTSSSSDIASKLQGKSYDRTLPLYSSTPQNFPESAWMGRMFATTPGAANWNFKTLKGISADNLSTTEITFAQGKNCNVYIPMGGVNIATAGITPSGQYIDVIVFIDWLTANLQSNVYSVLVNVDKVPYTNKGIVSIENPVAQTLQQGQNNGGLAPGWTVTAPDVSAVSTNDKANRVLNGVSFSAELAGAINKVSIQGFISV